MKKISSIYIEKEQSIEISNLKSRCLSRLFNCKSNSIVSFINDLTNHKKLTFIFEKNCDYESILLYSRLFLNTIVISFPELIGIDDFKIKLGASPISSCFHYHSKQSSLFAHSIILRKDKNKLCVGHLNENPKDFAILISNIFSKETNLIQKKIKKS